MKTETLTISDIQKRINDGYYENKVGWPPRPKLLAEGFAVDENKSVVWNRQEVLRLNQTATAQYSAAKLQYSSEEARLNGLHTADIISVAMDEGLSRKAAEIVYARAWEQGHSSGYSEVTMCASDLIDFAKEIVAAPRAIPKS